MENMRHASHLHGEEICWYSQGVQSQVVSHGQMFFHEKGEGEENVW